MSTARDVTVYIHADLDAFAAAMERIRHAALETAAHLDRLRRQADTWDRRRRRTRTHVWETPRASRMHTAYRAKTRRTNHR